eukprot:CAMPEP_0175275336 /NCGR_PEP_ID=MMETSP0093-20121207/47919_1 /TAXON_ID=311494 /ORGANISM="Alexandrium monilatum, Strain CCMP3105" /LENGTH=135 /DNA_ID=CAMNT_0016570215 /DNA_START=86 /DNA_END=493 /DNA_ORIENTATION=-
MRLISRALLPAALLAALAHSMTTEDGSGLEDAPALDGARGDGLEELQAHKHGPACVSHAEELERSVGLFDNHQMSAEVRGALAQRMEKHAVELLGASKPDFKDAMQSKLEEVHQQVAVFGAPDACRFLLQHHNEL